MGNNLAYCTANKMNFVLRTQGRLVGGLVLYQNYLRFFEDFFAFFAVFFAAFFADFFAFLAMRIEPFPLTHNEL